ncbi:MAG: transporter substrate-binding domain-containing protein [Proteobacteria bacterium]|nr:transporter substrate-binding domain-containing protein [Pseudomonadota bacterium]
MKKILILFLFILLSDRAMAKDKLEISFFHIPPHIFYNSETGQISGAMYEFLNHDIAPVMDVEFVWDKTPANVPRQLLMLEEEKRDAAAVLIYTPERSEEFAYSQTPFSKAKSVIAVLNGSRIKNIVQPDDLLGMKIGYAARTFLSPFMRDKRLKFEFISSGEPNEQNLKKLKAGRVDCIYIPDKAGLLMEIKNLKMEKEVRLIELPEKASPMHVVFSKLNLSYAKKYDKAFHKINGEAVYMKRLEKYLDVSKL